MPSKLRKSVIILFLPLSLLHAGAFLCVNQKGFDFGVGNERFDLMLQGDFSYMSADSTFHAWAIELAPAIEYRIFHTQHMKLYAACGVYFKDALFWPATGQADLSSDYRSSQRDIQIGLNILMLRPEAIINSRLSAYATIPVIRYVIGTQSGNYLLLSAFSSGVLGTDAGVPGIGLKFYF